MLRSVSHANWFTRQETGNSFDTERNTEERNVPFGRHCMGQGRFACGLNNCVCLINKQGEFKKGIDIKCVTKDATTDTYSTMVSKRLFFWKMVGARG